jgi:hypothetical protein
MSAIQEAGMMTIGEAMSQIKVDLTTLECDQNPADTSFVSYKS